MNVAKPLRVRKEPIEVELALTGETPKQVELFLAEHGSHHFNRQRVLELLDQAGSFLPVRDRDTGEYAASNSRAIVWIGMSRLSADAEGGDELYDYRKALRVELAGGRALEGEILYSAPEGAARLVDFLNRGERFFRLWSGERVFLVNKDFVSRIVEATIATAAEPSCK